MHWISVHTHTHTHTDIHYVRTMSVVRAVAVLLFLNSLWTLAGADVPVSCLFNRTCLLPCNFNPGREVLIHWHQFIGGSELVVHSYYNDKDQVAHQDPRFQYRTSLFNDLIARGNASLQLTRLQIEDQGRFRCYTSTTTGGTKQTIINLSVTAPVKDVDLRQVDNTITCSAGGLYPTPELVWSNMTQSDGPEVKESPGHLYNISSSVTLTQNNADLLHFSCSVTAGSSNRRSTLFKTTFVEVSNGEVSLTCSTLQKKPLTDLDLDRVWTWTFNHSQTILTQRGADRTVSERWLKLVDDGSEVGVLKLKDLSSEHHQGAYTCHDRDTEETFISSTNLKIEKDSKVGLIIGLTVPAAVVLTGLGIWFYKKKKTNSSRPY